MDNGIAKIKLYAGAVGSVYKSYEDNRMMEVTLYDVSREQLIKQLKNVGIEVVEKEPVFEF